MNRIAFVSRIMVALACVGAAHAQIRVDGGDIVAPGPKFNIDKFEQNIRIAVARRSVGFAYAISQHGQLKRADAGGKARTEVDVNQASFPNGIPQHESKRMNIASISKPITAESTEPARILPCVERVPAMLL